MAQFDFVQLYSDLQIEVLKTVDNWEDLLNFMDASHETKQLLKRFVCDWLLPIIRHDVDLVFGTPNMRFSSPYKANPNVYMFGLLTFINLWAPTRFPTHIESTLKSWRYNVELQSDDVNDLRGRNLLRCLNDDEISPASVVCLCIELLWTIINEPARNFVGKDHVICIVKLLSSHCSHWASLFWLCSLFMSKESEQSDATVRSILDTIAQTVDTTRLPNIKRKLYVK
jgi:hypothetical protein